MENGAVYYAKHQDSYVIKPTGSVRYQLGCSFDEFLKRLFAREDFNDILIDLTEVTMIDSTFLGLLAKIANYIRRRFDRKVTIISSNEDINKILDSVGFYSVFNISNADAAISGDADRMATRDADRSQLARTLYDAHRILSDLNEKNREMFKNVVEELQDKVLSCSVTTSGANPELR